MDLQSGSSEGIDDCINYRFAYHPLMNAEILTNLFSNFTIDECKPLRLVNKTWYEELQQRWMDETVVQVTFAQQPLDYDSDTDDARSPNLEISNCPHDCLSIDYFLRQLAHPSTGRLIFDGKPFRNLRTCSSCDYQIGLGSLSSAMDQLWNVCGQSLKYLHLSKVKFSSRRDVRKLLFELTPNLEELEFTSCACVSNPIFVEPTSFQPPAFTQRNLKSVAIGLEEQKFPISWMTFFSHFPRIENFELTSHGWDSTATDLRNVLDAIATVRQSMGNQELDLTQLHLNNYANNEYVWWPFNEILATKLCSLQLPLSNLTLTSLHINMDTLAQVIDSHRATLQCLDVSVKQPMSSFLFAFPYQVPPANLKKLKLRGIVFQTWEFLKYTPNLEKLVMSKIPEDYEPCVEFKESRVPVLTRLKKLEFDTNGPVSAKTVKFLIESMPNVTKLEMSVGTAGFKQICQGWNLRKWSALHCVVNEDDFVEHITLLSSLSMLQFYQKDDESEFGERAIHEGFLKLRNLSELYIHVSSQVSASSIELLKSQISEVYVE